MNCHFSGANAKGKSHSKSEIYKNFGQSEADSSNFSYLWEDGIPKMSTKNIYPNSESTPLSTAMVIHLFAVAHAVVALASRSLNYYDDVPLTILTLSMVVIISLRYRLKVEILAITTLVASFFGFLMGVYGGLFVRTLIRSDLWAPAIATFLVTELIGWGTYFVARARRNGGSKNGVNYTKNHHVTSVLLIAGTILLLRVCYMVILRLYYAEQENIYTELSRIFSNPFALLLLICGHLICVHFYNRNRHLFHRRGSHSLWILFSVVTISSLTTFCVLAGPLLRQPVTGQQFLRMEVVMLLLSVAAYALLYLGHYVVTSRRELDLERQQRNFAQYRYNRFKEQINPHFLFNSLNILDSLVQEGERDRAGAYIRKLAGIYRYMLRNEEEALIALREEIAFAEMYIDLIKERFTNGLEIEHEISPELLSRMVVPCSVQQLIENATKHNIVSAEEPLKIKISASDAWLTVENNLQPRISRRNESTHLGLKIISQQYYDAGGREIRITSTDTTFRVDLPLLKNIKA